MRVLCEEHFIGRGNLTLPQPGQIIKDRAVWAIIAVAALGQVYEGAFYRLQRGNAGIDLLNMIECQAFDVGAGTSLVAPERQ